MNDRRFNQTEVARIFEKATELQDARTLPVPATEGMTLAEFQEIGTEQMESIIARIGDGSNSQNPGPQFVIFQ